MSTYRNQQTICVSAAPGSLGALLTSLLAYATGSTTTYSHVSASNNLTPAQTAWDAYELYIKDNHGTVSQAITALENSYTASDYSSQVIYSNLQPETLHKVFTNATVVGIDGSAVDSTELGYNYVVHELQCDVSREFRAPHLVTKATKLFQLADNNPIDWTEVLADPHRKYRTELHLLSAVLGQDVSLRNQGTEGADVVVEFDKLFARTKIDATEITAQLDQVLDALGDAVVKDRAELHSLWLLTVKSLTYLDQSNAG